MSSPVTRWDCCSQMQTGASGGGFPGSTHCPSGARWPYRDGMAMGRLLEVYSIHMDKDRPSRPFPHLRTTFPSPEDWCFCRLLSLLGGIGPGFSCHSQTQKKKHQQKNHVNPGRAGCKKWISARFRSDMLPLALMSCKASTKIKFSIGHLCTLTITTLQIPW